MVLNRRSPVFFFCLFFLSAIQADAVHNRAYLGLGGEMGLKVYPVRHYNLLASYMAALNLRIESNSPGDLGALLSLGYHIDPVHYKLPGYSGAPGAVSIGFAQQSISITGLILFPTRKEYWKVLGGIGLEYIRSSDVSYRWRGVNANFSRHRSPDLEAIQGLVDDNRRNLLPALCFGFQYDVWPQKRLKMYVLLRQTLLHLYVDDIPLASFATGNSDQALTNYRPTYLKIGVNYELW